MRTFKDFQGDEWSIVFTAGDALRLRREIGFDVDALMMKTDKQIEEMLYDGNKILQILVLLLEDEIIRRGLTEAKGDKIVLAEVFGDRFQGDTIDDATLAFLLAVADSLPKLKRRALIEIIDKISPALEVAEAAMVKKIQATDLTEKITKAINDA